MSFNLNDQHLAIINAWERQFPGKFTEDEGNINLVLGFIQNHGNVLSVASLNAAARACHAALKFVPGHEPPDPRAEQKAQAEAARKRDLRLRAGLNVNQSKIKTELDDADDARRASQGEILAAARQDLEMKECLAEMNALIERHIANTWGGRISHTRNEREKEKLRSELARLVKLKLKPDILRERMAAYQNNLDNPSVR